MALQNEMEERYTRLIKERNLSADKIRDILNQQSLRPPEWARNFKKNNSGTFKTLTNTAKKLTQSRDGYYVVVAWWEKNRTQQNDPQEMEGEDLHGKYWKSPTMEVQEIRNVVDVMTPNFQKFENSAVILYAPDIGKYHLGEERQLNYRNNKTAPRGFLAGLEYIETTIVGPSGGDQPVKVYGSLAGSDPTTGYVGGIEDLTVVNQWGEDITDVVPENDLRDLEQELGEEIERTPY